MKTGILSMQRIFNYGSFLQAYGLRAILEEMRCSAEFVDYHPGKCLVPVDEGSGMKRKIGKAFEAMSYDAPLADRLRFIQFKRSYAKKYYPYLGITDQMNYNPAVDLLVIGSDEVFNCVQDNTNVGFCPELFGEGAKAKKVISYAASFGNTTLEKLEAYKVADKVATWLNRFNAISVRDKNSADIVKKLTGKEPESNLDPVLMYDFVSDCQYVPESVDASDYMILYGYSGRFNEEECKAIRDYAKEKRLKVLCIGGVQGCCDKFVDCNPFEVIAYFKNAQCVVTDTFHGTILSVITARPFVSFIRKSGYGNSEKMTDLLSKLELTSREVDDIKHIGDVMEKPIAYDKVTGIIALERARTKAYLRRQIA